MSKIFKPKNFKFYTCDIIGATPEHVEWKWFDDYLNVNGWYRLKNKQWYTDLDYVEFINFNSYKDKSTNESHIVFGVYKTDFTQDDYECSSIQSKESQLYSEIYCYLNSNPKMMVSTTKRVILNVEGKTIKIKKEVIS